MGDCRPVAGVRLATVLVVMDKNVHGRFESMTHTDSIASDSLAWRVYVGKRCKSRKAAIDKRRPGQRRVMHVERTELTKRRVSALADDWTEGQHSRATGS